jgi:hypothetical protein
MTETRRPFDLALPRARRQQAGLWGSVLVHALIVLLLVRQGDRIWSPTRAAGAPARTLGGGGGGGGGGLRQAYIPLPPLPAAAPRAPTHEHETPPDPVLKPVAPPVVRPPAAIPPPVDTPSRPPPAAASSAATDTSGASGGGGVGTSTGGGIGPGAGPGTGTGVGPGAGPDSGGGRGGSVTPPEPRAFAMTLESPPKELRGRELTVTWWVRADGTVERVETVPEIRDASYRQKFFDTAHDARFRPARSPDGRAVAATFTATYTLPTR